jgi:hypothetical protein
MKFLSLLLSIILCAAMLGCRLPAAPRSNPIAATSGTPQTPQQRLDALQADLDLAKGGANLAHELGRFNGSGEWEQLQTTFANAQLIITASRASIGEGALDQAAVTDLLNSAAQSVRDAKAAAK